MDCINIVKLLKVVTFTFGILSAWFWLRSSRVEYPDILSSNNTIGSPGKVNLTPLSKAIQENGRLNKLASIFTAITVLSSGLTELLSK